VKFDFTADELVDVNIRLVRETRTGQAARRNYRWSVAGAAAVTLTAVGVLDQGITTARVVAMASCGFVLGAICFALSGHAFDHRQRRWLRRAVDEHMTTSTDRSCELELRPDGIACRQAGAEMVFYWKRLQAIVEEAGDVEFRFTPGLVVARRRAFASDADRRAFVVAARELAALAVPIAEA
jgi:hypothetical protein